ncbi:Membrane-associated phosphatidylinositol transfer protein 1 [Fasciola hepatica]|uniref:Membrane-associated phosphatidylinositol transfer protein 1 n=1 Tax=Fasciola hepatica TaxID=6192 RepID=A0A4E0RI28_FASHE|nr:Membrane-associated phosphatidylinositol transfer protein 1 [Fasciola hepatica]
MLIKEYRICLPLTVEEYKIAQLFMIQKKSREESTGRESGVEIIKNEPYEEGPGGRGQYTYKIYHVGSHLPAWLRNILPPSALRVEEEAWNAYPYTRTIYRVPFVDKLTLDIETHYFDDGGQQDDVFKLNAEEKAARIVDFIDIVNDPVARGEYKTEEDTTLYISEATGRGPLTPTWRDEFIRAQTVTHERWTRAPNRTPGNQQADGPLTPLPKRIMCAYKLCRVEFRYWGMQKRVEQFIHDSALRKTMVRAHRQVWTWQDEWYGLTIEEIRQLEEETARALASKMAEGEAPNEPDAESTNVNDRGKVLTASTLSPASVPQSASLTFPDPSSVALDNQFPGSRIRSASQTLCCDMDPVEAQHLWQTFKKLEHNDAELVDYEPYGVLSDDDDTQSFVSCRSNFTGQTAYASASTSVTEGLHVIAGDEDLNVVNASDEKSTVAHTPDHAEKLVLIMVVHGGCLLDAGNDLITKRNDVNTWRRTLDTVIANHYPVLRRRVAVCLVPCPSGLDDTFRLLAQLKTSPIDPRLPTEMQISRDLIPLGSIPFFLTGSPKYPQMLDELVSRLNSRYAEFLRSPEGQNFHGAVCLMADSVGAILTHDVLNIVARQNDGALSESNPDGLSLIDAGARRWRQPIRIGNSREMDQFSQETVSTNHETSTLVQPESNSSDSPLLKRHSTTVRLCTLDFHVQCFIMLGSPVGLLLAFRNQMSKIPDPLNKDEQPLLNAELCIAADQVCNLFHMNDPCSFRIEPILHPRFDQIAPLYVPQYAFYPLGDSQPTSLIETLVRQAKLFESDLCAQPNQPDGNLMGTPGTVVSNPKNGRSWEKATMIAFEALKKIRHNWWGQHRVDYSVHCPEGVQALLAGARAPIFHASYWESSDVAAFVLRQLLEILGFSLPETSYAVDLDDDVAVSGLMDLTRESHSGLNDTINTTSSSVSVGNRPSANLSLGSRFRLRRQGSEGSKNVKSNHRANDVIVGEGEPQILTARFVFGLLDLASMINEKVLIQTRSLSGTWTPIGTETTDSSGRIHYQVPDQRRFGVGLHSILLSAESDREHPIQLTLAVIPPHTEAVVFSVDGSFAASLSIMGKDPKIRPGAVDVARHWYALGYLIIYLSARPDMQQRRVTSWLANHNFPQGITLFVEGISTDPLRQKCQLLKNICQKVQLKIHCAYGSGKDVSMYRSFNVPPQNIFVVGRISRSQAAQSTPLTRGYAVHLSQLTAGHVLSRPVVRSVNRAMGQLPFDRPASLRISPPQPDQKSNCSVSSK